MPRRTPNSSTGACNRPSNTNLPDEAEFLRRYDAFRTGLNLIVDMPERLSDLMFRFLRQNNGTLSRRGRTREFSPLTDPEVARIEGLYRQVFDAGEREAT